MTDRPIYRDGYARVGDSSEYMDVAIDINDAHTLRDSVVDAFTPYGMTVKALQTVPDETDQTVLQYKAFFRAKTRAMPTVDSMMDEASIFVGALINQSADAWRLTIMRNRFGRIDDGLTEQRISTIYKVICWGEQVMQANRTVKLCKSTASLALHGAKGDAIPVLERQTKRIGFTTPVQPEDCQTISDFVKRHSARVKIERGI